jgi:hypothetical protein
MTQLASSQPESDILAPESSGAFAVPPPVPQKKPGFLRRMFTSRKKQQAVAIQNGYLEMVDLIRAIRSHLDRQENVQTSLLTMLERVPDVMERQQEVMTIFKQQLENGMENNRRLTDSMGNLNNTLASMDESQRASSRTVTDLIHRSRESEQLLREVMRRAERRMTILLVVFFLLVVGLGLYFLRWQPRAEKVSVAAPAVAPAVEEEPAPPPTIVAKPAIEKEPAKKEPAPEFAPAPEKKKKSRSKVKPESKPAAAAEPAVGQPDLTLDQLRPDIAAALSAAPVPSEPPASFP